MDHMFRDEFMVRLCEAGYYPWFMVILVKEYTLVSLGSAISPRSTDSGFIAEDSKFPLAVGCTGSLRVERGLEAYFEMSSILVLGIV
ncbi:hypothetical protein L6452_18459 [Arctium lappa]|uniref:Uncharacterized protein n=1 Tax=Arctium lappa TaxID=4217 RepID=A0ACB9C698_ARCLA|nr:hypothetical protein L6452_18459 [Arctium lappa]